MEKLVLNFVSIASKSTAVGLGFGCIVIIIDYVITSTFSMFGKGR